jgi:hypothetical protein
MSPNMIPFIFFANNFVSNFTATFLFINDFFQMTESRWSLWVGNMTLDVDDDSLRRHRCFSTWATEKPQVLESVWHVGNIGRWQWEWRNVWTLDPKIIEVLDTISKEMNWMERQSDCDHLHLLHLQNIKTYVMKKCQKVLHQKKISEYFKNSN